LENISHNFDGDSGAECFRFTSV